MKAIVKYLLAFGVSLLTWQTHAEPYLLHTSGTMVLDKATGLVWMRCTLGETWDGKACAGKKRWLTFNEATQAAKELNKMNGFGGYSDWAIPKATQLFELVDCFGKLPFPIVDKDFNPPTEGELSNPKLHTYCSPNQTEVEFVNRVAFPSTASSAYWSSSLHLKHNDVAWIFSFAFGSVIGIAGYHDTYQVLLVRSTKLSVNEAVAGFTQTIPSGIEVFRAAQKPKQ